MSAKCTWVKQSVQMRQPEKEEGLGNGWLRWSRKRDEVKFGASAQQTVTTLRMHSKPNKKKIAILA